MRTLSDRYINPFTDFGFKKIFGEEPNKDLLIDFLNQLLQEEQSPIIDLEYLQNEQLGRLEIDRGAIFDLYCRNERGERFIVELQKSKQKFFKDRTVYYSTFPIRDQARKGTWNFALQRVYMVAILDFVFDEDRNDPDKFQYIVKLSDIETNEVFYDQLSFVYLEMPKFQKSLGSLQGHFDKWLYALKNMPELAEVPADLQEEVFVKLFETAEIANFNDTEYSAYEGSLKHYRDTKNTVDTAREEGREEGHKEGRDAERHRVAVRLLRRGMSVDEVAEITALSPAEVERLGRD